MVTPVPNQGAHAGIRTVIAPWQRVQGSGTGSLQHPTSRRVPVTVLSTAALGVLCRTLRTERRSHLLCSWAVYEGAFRMAFPILSQGAGSRDPTQ